MIIRIIPCRLDSSFLNFKVKLAKYTNTILRNTNPLRKTKSDKRKTSHLENKASAMRLFGFFSRFGYTSEFNTSFISAIYIAIDAELSPASNDPTPDYRK